jgi:hypothetical protein
MIDLTQGKRISNAYLTARAADLSQSNASNGFDFASQPQPPVERAAHQALASEKTLPKCIPTTTPTTIMAGPGSVIRCARKRERFRARERRQSGGRASGTQLSLSRACARPLGDRPKPGHDNDLNPIPGMPRERRLNHQAHQDHEDAQLSRHAPRARSAQLKALRADRACPPRAEHLGALGVLGGSTSLFCRLAGAH